MIKIIRYIFFIGLAINMCASCAKKCYKCEKIEQCVECTAKDKNTGNIRSRGSFCGEEYEAKTFEHDFKTTWAFNWDVTCTSYQESADLREECVSRADAEDDMFILELTGYTCN